MVCLKFTESHKQILAISIPKPWHLRIWCNTYFFWSIYWFTFQVFVLILLKHNNPGPHHFFITLPFKKKTDWQPLPRRLGAWRFQAAPAPPRGIQSTPVMRRFPYPRCGLHSLWWFKGPCKGNYFFSITIWLQWFPVKILSTCWDSKFDTCCWV